MTGKRVEHAGQVEQALQRVQGAARNVVSATGTALGALEVSATDAALRQSQKHAQDQFNRDTAILRNRSAQALRQGRDRIATAVSALAPGACSTNWSKVQRLGVASDPLAEAGYVRAGSLRIAGEGLGVSEGFSAPLIVPLLDRGNLVLTADPKSPAVRHMVQNLTVRALAGTGPGQLVLRGFDPALRGHLAPFTALREVSEELFPAPGGRAEDLEELLYQLANDVRRVADLGRGHTSSLGALRRNTEQPIETYQLVVLLDYPRGITERSADLLADLLRTGPPHGVSFLIHHDPDAVNGPAAAIKLDRDAQTLTVRQHGCMWSQAPELGAEIEAPSADQLQATMAEVALAARQASAPRIPFTDVQQTGELWIDSSAPGITAAFGRAGHETVVLSLGDEREQRHNLLVTGAVGQGKSNFLKVLIHSLAVRYSPDELELYLLDFKDGVTFFPLAPSGNAPEWLPHAKVIGLESDRQYGVAVLEHLFAEFDRRAKLIKPHGDNIATYREQVPDGHMPRVVAVIDEFQVLFEEDDPITDRAVQLLERLARRGRAYGIHLVLASQTISGITALMAKESGIYSQFPIRIALKNSASESRAVLEANNTEAARLRFRGEAVVNLDFGQVEGNRRAVIAVADDAELSQLRRQCWNRRKADAEPPAVFDGRKAPDFASLIPQLRALRAQARLDSSTRAGLLGVPIAVSRWPVGVPLPPLPGRHLAIVGAGQRARPFGEPAGDEPNLAVGVLHAAAVSLALQHPAGDADFTILNLLSDAETRNAGMPHLLSLLERLGFPVTVYHLHRAMGGLRQIATLLAERPLGGSEPAHYVIALAIDRAGSLEAVDETFAKPIDDLRAILRDGPARRTHVLGWWSNAGMFKSHLGFDSSISMDAILALRVEQRDVTDLMGHTVTWSPQDNRGLLFDRTQLAAPLPIVPMTPLDEATHNLLLRTDWDVR